MGQCPIVHGTYFAALMGLFVHTCDALWWWMHARSVVQLCLTLCDTLDCSPLHSSVCGIFPDKNTGVHCQFPLQGIFPTQGSSLHLLHHLHCRQSLYC